MVPSRAPSSPFDDYERLWKRLVEAVPELVPLFPVDNRIGVQWGHEMPDSNPPLRADEKLTLVQSRISDLVSYDAVRQKPGPNNVVMSGLLGGDWGPPVLRSIVVGVRESIIQYGLADVVYYTSADGEEQVRGVVYGQVLERLEPYRDRPDVRLHLLGHSLGVTLTHDFLYGLFAKHGDPSYTPGFVQESQGTPDAIERFGVWRAKAQDGSLRLGSLTSAASQLPIFLMRKQALVDRIHRGELLQPTEIGVTATDHVQWQLFYDIDDILGMASRDLYSPAHAIRELQVDSGDLPGGAHADYWANATVVSQTAALVHATATR